MSRYNHNTRRHVKMPGDYLPSRGIRSNSDIGVGATGKTRECGSIPQFLDTHSRQVLVDDDHRLMSQSHQLPLSDTHAQGLIRFCSKYAPKYCEKCLYDCERGSR